MRRHRIDLLSLVLGLLAIAMAVAGLTGTIDAAWLDPTVAVSIAALVAVVVVVAVVINLAVLARRTPGAGAVDESASAPQRDPLDGSTRDREDVTEPV